MEDLTGETQAPSLFDITISESVIYSFEQICKWVFFQLYVVGGSIVLGVLIALLDSDSIERSLYSKFGEYTYYVAGTFVIVIIIYCAFLGLLFNFALKVKKGMAKQDVQKVEQGVASLKIYFILSGIGGMLYILTLVFGVVRLGYT